MQAKSSTASPEQLIDNIEGLINDLSMKVVKAKTGIAYAINLMFGAELADFERANLIAIAHELSVNVSAKEEKFELDRKILLEVLAERKVQVHRYGFTPEADAANPVRIHQEILNRVSQTPTAHARQSYLEAAAILVAEIGVIDRAMKPVVSAVDATLKAGMKISAPGHELDGGTIVHVPTEERKTDGEGNEI